MDYLLHGFYKNTVLKHQQMATAQTMRQFRHLVKPPTLMMEVNNRQRYINGNSMLLLLISMMRTMHATQPNKIKVSWPGDDKKEMAMGAFNMDDMERLASLMPEEVLPPYRKNRSYINSVLASNETSRALMPGCKLAFKRVQRGWYILNPNIKW